MTVLAYRNGVLAADTLITGDNRRDGYAPKIVQRAGILAGATGALALCQEFLDWFVSGMESEPPDLKFSDFEASGVVFPGGDLVLIRTHVGWERIRTPFYAAGSGGDFAIGAMAMGATAEQAVAAAIVHDKTCGGEITVLRSDR